MKTLEHTRTALLIFLLLPLLAVECYDEPFAPKLPEATQTGEGMMAAKVNGVVWIAEGGLIGENPEAEYWKEEGRLTFGGSNRKGKSPSGLSIVLRDVYTPGEYYAWGSDTFIDGTRMIFTGKGSFKNCSPQQSNPGSVTITNIDTIGLIVSGTFEFDGICDNGDTVKIRDGRFDIVYKEFL